LGDLDGHSLLALCLVSTRDRTVLFMR